VTILGWIIYGLLAGVYVAATYFMFRGCDDVA